MAGGTEITRNDSGRRSRLRRVIRWALVLEIAWLLLLNGLLWLPATQQLVSAVRPEKFAVRWERAWTLAPFHVGVEGLFANGSSRRQVWQVEAATASGWINPLPLLWKHVSLHRVAGVDVDYRQRPRPRPDRDYAATEAWFPEIEGRAVRPADDSPYRGRRAWTVALHAVELQGRLRYWVYQLRGEAQGRLRGDLDYRTRGGPLRLDVERFDLELGRHLLAGDRVVFDRATARGSLGFAPFRPREDRGAALLRALSLDLETEVDLDSLAFLNVFLLDIRPFDVDGSGIVVGRLRYRHGEVLPGTDLAVAARELEADLMGHRIEGMGSVSLRFGEDTAGQMALGFYYGDLRVVRDADDALLLTGQGMRLTVGGDGRVLPDPEGMNPSRFIHFDIGRLVVPDLAAYQSYLPPRWPFRLHGGAGILRGTARLQPTSYALDLGVESNEADLGIADYRFVADLDAVLRLENPTVAKGGARVDGSYLRLDKARVRRAGAAGTDDGWRARFEVSSGRMDVLAARRTDERDVMDLFRTLADAPLSELLAGAAGDFEFTGEVSKLDWLAVFFGDRYRTRVGGAASLAGAARLAAGLPAAGTDVTVRSDGLLFNFLDYASRGRGAVRLAVEEGGEVADWRVAVDLEDADLRRRGDDATFVRDVRMNAEALIENVGFDGAQRDYELAFRMPSARVTDVAVFNRYLPAGAPLALIGGEAGLAADLRLKPDDADGWVRLDGERIGLTIDEQEVRADLRAEIAVRGGRPADMAFDVGGSRVRLENVGVRGAGAAFEDAGWFAELTLTRGETVFREPLRLGVDAELRASDSRPLVTLFRNQDGWRPDFLARALTVEAIAGRARLEIADRRLRIPFSWLNGEHIEAGAKAELSAAGNRGIVYLKYRDLDAVLRVVDGKRNLDVLRARRKFDEYRVEGQ